jgi:hypothetical protein
MPGEIKRLAEQNRKIGIKYIKDMPVDTPDYRFC